MSFRLPTTEEKAEYVLDQFDRIAKGYDLANDAISLGMHRLWKRKVIKSMAMKADGHYLDVCCGTGDLTLQIANHLSPKGKVTGLDFSNNMLEIARLRAAKWQNKYDEVVQFVQGDAQNLPFADHTFDGAVISFGLRNLTRLDRGLAEIMRVVKPGTKIANLDLGRPSNFMFAPIYYFYFRHLVPLIGQILQNDRKAYTYLPQSLSSYPNPAGISALFRSVGLQNVEHIPLAMGSVALHIGTKP